MKVAEFNRKMMDERRCGNCPMLGKAFVGADSWNGETGHVSVLFLGLNPGVEEAKAGLPFVGPSGTLLRSVIRHFPDASWAIVNSILCSSPNQNGINDPDASRASCRGNVGRFWSEFTPDIIVPCGNGASSVFEIPDGITWAENMHYISRGKNFRGRPTLVMPIQHPSAIIRSGGIKSAKWPAWSARLGRIFETAEFLKGFASPEEALANAGLSWTGLFGYKGE